MNIQTIPSTAQTPVSVATLVASKSTPGRWSRLQIHPFKRLAVNTTAINISYDENINKRSLVDRIKTLFRSKSGKKKKNVEKKSETLDDLFDEGFMEGIEKRLSRMQLKKENPEECLESGVVGNEL